MKDTFTFIFVAFRYLTECYDEYGTQYKVPIYCLSYPINIVKEETGRDSPAEYSEPVDGGFETTLKLRLSSTCSDIEMTVYSRDTIGQCKKKIQVRGFACAQKSICLNVTTWLNYGHFSIFGRLESDIIKVIWGNDVEESISDACPL